MADKPVKILAVGTVIVSAAPAVPAIVGSGQVAIDYSYVYGMIWAASHAETLEMIQGFASSMSPSPPESNWGSFAGWLGQFDNWLYNKTNPY